jgi:LAGLIDADG DNA endonuclease family
MLIGHSYKEVSAIIINSIVLMTERLKITMPLLSSSSAILPNGERCAVKDLSIGSKVFGVDANGDLVATKILDMQVSKAKSGWTNVQTSRHESALGNSRYSLIATDDHQIFLHNNEKVSLAALLPEDLVFGISTSLNLDHIQKSILVGILLGDGSLDSRYQGWSLRWSHSEKQEEYLRWTVNALGSIAKVGHEDLSGYGSRMLTARTVQHPDIQKLFVDFNKPEGVIPDSVKDFINPFSLAFWYMDDGSLMHHPSQQDRVTFATYSFSDQSIINLQNGLKTIGIQSVIQQERKGKTIRLNRESARFMFSLISSIIPPSMQYKLPSDLRGGPGWLPSPEMVPGYRDEPLRVLSIQPASRMRKGVVHQLKSQAFTIITTTGNMYVNGMLLNAS